MKHAIKKAVHQKVKEGTSYSKVAALFEIGKTTVHDYFHEVEAKNLTRSGTTERSDQFERSEDTERSQFPERIDRILPNDRSETSSDEASPDVERSGKSEPNAVISNPIQRISLFDLFFQNANLPLKGIIMGPNMDDNNRFAAILCHDLHAKYKVPAFICNWGITLEPDRSLSYRMNAGFIYWGYNYHIRSISTYELLVDQGTNFLNLSDWANLNGLNPSTNLIGIVKTQVPLNANDPAYQYCRNFEIHVNHNQVLFRSNQIKSTAADRWIPYTEI